LKTGDIYWVNLDPSIGDEIRKKRPVVIMDAGHVKNLRLAIVVPVTGWKPQWQDHPFFVPKVEALAFALLTNAYRRISK
jgi:mRNA interferase MazF